jgi:hypothetical protein
MGGSRLRRLALRRAGWTIMGAALSLNPGELCAEPGALTEAREHFDRGVQLYGGGELDQALLEFELAHQLQPHFAVLYNLGQTHAALGHPVEAVDAYRRYLAEGNNHIDSARRAQVEATILFHEKRIGALELRSGDEGIECQLDGCSVSCNLHAWPLSVGRHLVVAKREGFETQLTAVEISPRGTTSVELALQAKRQAPPTLPAWLRIECPVPDVTVRVDGVERGRTPLGDPLPVDSGPRTVQFTRAGYLATEQDLQAASGRTSDVSCNSKPNPTLHESESGILDIATSQAHALVWVDGAQFSGQRLPLGQHGVEIRRWGFLPWTKHISITTQRPTRVFATLIPTPEYLEQYTINARRDRTIAYVTGATGVAAGAAAVGLFIYSTHRFNRWQSDRAQLAADVQTGAAQDFGSRLAQLNNDEAKILWADDASFVLACLGGAMLATATSLLIWGKDPDKFKSLRTNVGTKRPTGSWVVRW